ncbi:MAG: DNA-formamidopyrimidine glycosylase [Candidatus Pacebacteria bacterium]|nr:DNA-formamidopyrimidine glycosylase [Candidatus Paceibacterota bacterium]
MPELPEVETTVKILQTKVLLRTFVDIWTNSPSLIKRPQSFLEFKFQVKSKKILSIERRGKNIIFILSDNLAMLVHQKMTGHLLYGKWKEENGKWVSQIEGSLKSDNQNRFLHLIFFLDNGYQMALSDLRKFAKVELWPLNELSCASTLKKLGQDALKISLINFIEKIKNQKGKIKQVLMDQEIIAGIGNIYSDEILFKAKINPQIISKQLKQNQIKAIYKAMQFILKLAIKKGGTSFSDFRDPNGEKGNFGNITKVYRKFGQKCPRCKEKISRIKIGGRSAHFCPKCQKG